MEIRRGLIDCGLECPSSQCSPRLKREGRVEPSNIMIRLTIVSDHLPDENRPGGRPRSETSQAAILEAAYSFLEEQPLSSISPLRIARRAGVSTATVYRWWPTKEALLLDAFLHKTQKDLALSSAGDPLLRLKQHLLEVGRFFRGGHGVVVVRMFAAMQDNPTIRDSFLERITSPRSKEVTKAVKAAVREGQLPPKTDAAQFADMLFGPLVVRLLMGHRPLSDAFVSSVFDHAVAGVRAIHAEGKTTKQK